MSLSLIGLPVTADAFQRVLMKDSKCNDGSPAAYYIAANASSPNFVVWLQGGGICQSEDDCKNRPLNLRSSKGYAPTFTPSPESMGMLANDPSVNPDLFTWNRVFVPYCSGDVWGGQLPDATNPFTDSGSDWTAFFHGHRIVANVVDELFEKHDAASAEKAVLTGCSAGGIGTFTNCDYFADRYKGAGSVGCRPEAGWFGLANAHWPYYSSSGGPASDPDPRSLASSSWTAKVQPYPLDSAAGKACAAAVQAGTLSIDHCDGQPGGQESCCALPEYQYAFSSTRMFVSENTADAYQVFSQGGCPSAFGSCAAKVTRQPQEAAYWGYVRDHISSTLTKFVVDGPKKDADGVFAPACLMHCMKRWQGSKVGGRTDAQAFGDWFFKRGGTSMSLDNSTDAAQLCECAAAGEALGDKDWEVCSRGGFGVAEGATAA